MLFKTDTKEKFHVITLTSSNLSANMTGELRKGLSGYLESDDAAVRNVILNLSMVEEIELPAANTLVDLQQQFYEQDVSLVICEIQKKVERFLDDNELLELMNVTPTESEAWDIIQMEEIERELLGDDENLTA